MQLFVCEFKINKNQITLEDDSVLYQLRKVLRSKIGDNLFVQNSGSANNRYEIKIDKRDDKKLVGTIINIMDNQSSNNIYGMIICMPNKWDKAEIIVQKLTEIGINHIIFWPSERSIIREINQNKIERLEKISKEALEQSWGWNLPRIEFVYDLNGVLVDSSLIVFDKSLNAGKTLNVDEKKNYGLVGPEGGLTDNDYKKFGNDFIIKSFGNNILRTETAAIIGGWIITQNK
ncbi:MAG: RsmE family RNA methyltransferase [Candidatus Absconditicoccaceae bacterium]